MTDSPVLQRVRELIEPIASDLDLDLYDLEQRGGTLRVTIDTPPGSEGAHFQREIGKTINVRLADTNAEQRRFEGVLVAADDTTATVRLDDADLTEQVVALADIDRARTVFVWGPQPKPGGKGAPKKRQKSTKSKSPQPSKSGAQQSSDSKKEPS